MFLNTMVTLLLWSNQFNPLPQICGKNMSSFACGGRSTKGCVGKKERLGWRGWSCYPGLRSATGKMMWKGSEEEKTDGKLRSGDGMEEICLQNVKEDECATRFFR